MQTEKPPLTRKQYTTNFSLLKLFLTLLSLTSIYFSNLTFAAVPDWVRVASLGGTDISSDMSESELNSILNQRLLEKVSVLEFDSRLSEYLTESAFDSEVAFLDNAAQSAHALGMHAVIYYPSLEVITPNGENIANTMFKDHPDWVQYGLGGEANVFYGSQEHWVDPGAESAWMSPNSPYREYYLNRIRKLAATSLDGVWVDVPIYLDTGTDWAGAGTYAAEDFRTWSIANGLGGTTGYDMPNLPNFNDPAFRAWIRWRHENLAIFLEDVRLAAHEINPDFMIVIENFPMDYMDATKAGLDGAFRESADNFIRVWEVDSVSNTRGMQWSNFDDFSNKITMFKWANAVEHENPAWVFSYGGETLDASLVLAATVATGNAPFEAQTPDMTQTVDSAMRSRWFNYLRNNETALLQTSRNSRVGIWYSSASRDYQDFSMGGEYGMYSTTTPPAADSNWWSKEAEDSVIRKPHLGGYRGAGYALTQLTLPYSIVADPGEPANDLNGISLLWLPSVAAISNESANIIEQFVANGGIVLATGELPGQLDEMGNQRSSNAFSNLFAFPSGVPGSIVNPFGDGLAIYRPDIRGSDLFGEAGDPDIASATLNDVEALMRSYVPQDIEIDSPSGIHAELARVSNNLHYLYLVNFTGLQLPLVPAPKSITVYYRAPTGYQVVAANTSSPDIDGQQGVLTVTEEVDGRFRLDITVDQFSLITLSLITTDPGANNAPIANSDNLNTEENIAITFTAENLLANDTDFDNDTLVVSSIVNTSGNGGTITDNGSGTYTYTPPSGYTGTDSFIYSIDDSRGGQATGTVYVTINPGPIPLPTVYHPELITISSGSYDWGTLISFHASDADTYDILTAADGDLEVIDWYASTNIVNTPSSVTELTVTYKGQYSVAAVTQEFYLYNFATTSWDFFDSRNVGNSDDVTISVVVTSNAQDYISTTGEVRTRIRGEKAAAEYFVWANFLSWEVMDTAENNSPVANDNALNIIRDTPVTVSESFLLANDSDPDGDILHISSIDNTSSQGGTIVDNGDGSYVYTPPFAFIGVDTFNYSIEDARGGVDSAAVTVTVTEPSNINPVANNDTLSTLQNNSVSFDDVFLLSNDVDTDGDIITVNNIDPTSINGGIISSLGGGNYNYDPPTDFVGQDSFSYSISDGKSGVATATVTVTITGQINNPPNAIGNTYLTDQDVNITISGASLLANDTDPDGDTLSLSAIDTISEFGGSIINLGNDLYTYTPPTGFSGIDTFNYSISDGNGGIDTAIVTVRVLQVVNNSPVANDDALNTVQAVPTNFSATYLLANDTDADGDSVTISQIDTTSVVGGNISNNGDGTYTYTPLLSFFGNDSFNYQISDGKGGNDTALVTITVIQAVNTPPIANSDSLNTVQAVPTNFSATYLLANDTDADGDSVTISQIDTTSVSGGNISDNGDGTYTYTPLLSFFGNDSFNYQISDGKGGVDTANVVVTVIPVINTPPVASDDEVTTNQDTPLTLTVAQLLLNDNDEDGDILSINNLDTTSQMNGTIVNNNDGTLTYFPPIAYFGLDSFSYTVNDGNDGSDSADVLINVNAIQPPPEEETLYPDSIIIETGVYDWGTLSSFVIEDNDTYDIRSIALDDGQLVDWYATTNITGSPNQVTEIEVSYKGQYSRRNVSQSVYLYNYQIHAWQQIDSRTVGNTDDVTISIEIESNPQNYISIAGKMRVRVRGFRSSRRFYVWANFLSWEIEYRNPNTGEFSEGNEDFSDEENDSDDDSDEENEISSDDDEREFASGVLFKNTNSVNKTNGAPKTSAASLGLFELMSVLLFSFVVVFKRLKAQRKRFS